MTGVPLQDAMLDAAALAQLVLDVEQAAELIAVMIRPLGARRATMAPASLGEAHRALRDRTASVQLRYRHAGEEWWDTLLPLPSGTRLVRINHTRALAADPS